MSRSNSRLLPAQVKLFLGLFLGALLALSTVTIAEANGVNTAGTVRVNNMLQLQTMLNIGAYAISAIGTAVGSAIIITCLRNITIPHGKRCFRVALGALLLLGSASSPAILSFMIVSARDASCASLF